MTNNPKLIIPINFTHSADIDGIACALLTKMGLRSGSYNNYSILIDSTWVIPLSANAESMEPVIKKINSQEIYNRVRSGIILSKVFNFSDYDDSNITFLLIVTDLYVPMELIDYFKDEISDAFPSANIIFWQFDHHKSSPIYSSYSCTYDESKPGSLPSHVSINFNYVRQDMMFCEPLVNLVSDYKHVCLQPIGRADHTSYSNILMFYGMLKGSEAERSATFIYFRFLFDMGLFDTLPMYIFTSLVKLVYNVSNYDTFEFQKLNPVMPVRYDYEDALTLLWKSYKNNFNEFLISLHDATWNNEYENELYPMLPNLSDEDLNKIKFLYKQRDAEFSSVMKGVKFISFEEFKKAVGEINSNIPDDSKIALIVKDVDASYCGNRLVQDYPDLSFACICFTDSRTISLRSSNRNLDAPDVSVITKQLGGGGHKYAAGTMLQEVSYCNLLFSYWRAEKPDIK